MRSSKPSIHQSGHTRIATYGIVLVALGLRLWNLGGQSFWWDEAYSTEVARRSLVGIVEELRTFDFHPPLHYFVLHYWARLAGESEFALRYLSVLASVLAVAVAVALGRRLYGDGIVAGLVFATAPFHVYYAQETRMYALVVLWTVLTLYCFSRAASVRAPAHVRGAVVPPPHPGPGDRLESPPATHPGAAAEALPGPTHRPGKADSSVVSPNTQPAGASGWRWWLLLAVAMTFGLYTFYYFVFVPLAVGVFTLAVSDRWRLIRGYIAAGAVAGVLYLPWLPILIARNQVWQSDWASVQSPLRTLAWTWPALTLGLPEITLYQSSAMLVLLVAASIPLILATTRLWRDATHQSVALALMAGLLPLVVMALISAVRPVYHPRYAMPTTVGLYLAFAAGASHPRGWLRVAGTLSIAAVFGVGISAVLFAPSYAREDYRSAVAYLQQQVTERDIVLYNAPPAFLYYYRGAAPAAYFGPTPYNEETVAAELNRLVAGHERLWYFTHHNVPTDPEGLTEALLQQRLPPPTERWFGPLRVRGYVIPPGTRFDVGEFQPATAQFTDRLRLTGFRLPSEVTAGQHAPLALAWEVLAPPDADYGIGILITDASGTVWGRDDRRPRNQERVLSSGWKPGDTFVTTHEISPLLGTPPGAYQVELIVYRLNDLRELELRDAAGRPIGTVRYPLATVNVKRPEAPVAVPAPGAAGALAVRRDVALAPEASLVGYELGSDQVAPGEKLELSLLWRATREPKTDYVLTVAGIDARGGQRVIQTTPLGGAGYPTSRWVASELVRSQLAVTVPADTPSGPLELRIGVAPPGIAPDRWESLGRVEIRAIQRQFEAPTNIERVDASLGDEVRLLGYRLAESDARRGQPLHLTLYWQALRTPTRSYHVFVHLADASLKPLSQRDGVPRNWEHPTTGWLPGEVVEDSYELTIPADAPPGSYPLLVGMYEPNSGERLAVADGDGQRAGTFIQLGTIELP